MRGVGRKWLAGVAGLAVVAGFMTSAVSSGAGAAPPKHPAGNRADQGRAVASDVSAPLRDLHPGRRIARSEHPDSPMPTPAGATVADPVVQSATPGASAPTASAFPGVG